MKYNHDKKNVSQISNLPVPLRHRKIERISQEA